jgi:hypothetical protein
LEHRGGELVGNNFMVGQIFENWSKKKRLAPWMEKGAQNLLAQIGGSGV